MSIPLRELEKYDQARTSVFYYKTDVPSSLIASLSNKQKQAEDLEISQIYNLFNNPVDIDVLCNKGTFHNIYLISELIFKNQVTPQILRVNASENKESKDYSLLLDHCLTNYLSSRCKNISFPVVKSHSCDLSRNILNFDYQLMDLALGQELTSLRNTESYQQILTNLGAELRKLHSICGEGYGLVSLEEIYTNNNLQGLHKTWREYFNLNLNKHIDFCFDKGYININEHKDIYSLFSEHRELIDSHNTSLLHCDLGDHNIFSLNNNITAILDWEDVILGEPIYDIALWATFHSEQDYQYFLQGYYGGLDNLPENFWSRFWLYYLRVAIVKTVHRHKFGYQDKPGALPASTRIQKAISKLDKILNGVIAD